VSEQKKKGQGDAAPLRGLPGVNAAPSELERARMLRVLGGPSRDGRRGAVQQSPRSDAVLSELRACRNDVASLMDLVEGVVASRQTTMPGDVLTRFQVAELLNICVESVTKLVRDEGLPCKRVGKEYRFLRSEVLGWLSARAVCSMGGA